MDNETAYAVTKTYWAQRNPWAPTILVERRLRQVAGQRIRQNPQGALKYYDETGIKVLTSPR